MLKSEFGICFFVKIAKNVTFSPKWIFGHKIWTFGSVWSRGTRTAFGNGHFLSARKGPAFANATPEKIENSLLIISCGTLGQK